MPINAWLRPPRHLVVLFLGITLVLIVALGWLGGRLLQQDRALERQRVQDRLELAADRAAAAFARRLAVIEDSLVRLATSCGGRLHLPTCHKGEPSRSASWQLEIAFPGRWQKEGSTNETEVSTVHRGRCSLSDFKRRGAGEG